MFHGKILFSRLTVSPGFQWPLHHQAMTPPQYMRLKFQTSYIAPNRRHDKPVTELCLEWSEADEKAVDGSRQGAHPFVNQRLADLGVQPLSSGILPGDPETQAEWFGRLLATLAIHLQNACGHAVDFQSVLLQGQRLRVLFEHDEGTIGSQAAAVALALLSEAIPGISDPPDPYDQGRTTGERWRELKASAEGLVQPADTALFCDIARCRDIPFIRLERDPYEGVRGDFRIRKNSMVMFGQCGSREIIDGSLPITRPGAGPTLLESPTAWHGIAVRMGLPVAAPAEQAAATHHLLVAGGRLIAALGDGREVMALDSVHPELAAAAAHIAHNLGLGLLAIGIRTPGISTAQDISRLVITGLDPAPRIDELLSGQAAMMLQAAEAFMDWLIPDPVKFRIPVIGVTGTNGKTTTCRMIDAILRQSGKVTGLQCTDGRYVNGELVQAEDNSALMGHYRIFEDDGIEAAVLECHHRGIGELGYAFHKCDVAVCTNVTEDHLGEADLDTLEDLAALKRSLPERARNCAVLNADNDITCAMRHGLEAPVCLVSTLRSAHELMELENRPDSICVIEPRDGREWIVYHKGGQCLDVVAVADVPACFQGHARFNVENAMHAIAAAIAAGVDPETVRQAMKRFEMNPESTPGRLNIYDGLPFRVLVDFAHNRDGLRRLSEFCRLLPVEGRRILALSAFRSEENIRAVTDSVCGHFDHYIIKEYDVPEDLQPERSRAPGDIADIVHAQMLQNGVPVADISIIVDERAAIHAALDMARPGDLLAMNLGYIAMEYIDPLMKAYIRDYGAPGPA